MRDNTDSDHDLMQRTAAGDHSAFEELVRRYQHLVVNFAFRFVGNTADAADLAQEAFIRIYQAATRYTEQATFKTWLFTIVKRLCLDWSRKRRPDSLGERTDFVSTDSPARDFEQQEMRQLIHQAILSLPENQRIALLLQNYEGLSYAEVSQVMNISIPAVESLLVRAKRTLRTRLAGLSDSI